MVFFFRSSFGNAYVPKFFTILSNQFKYLIVILLTEIEWFWLEVIAVIEPQET